MADTTNKLVFQDFAACVRVDKKTLQVYAPEYDEATKTATGWIASESGKAYSVRFRRMKDVGADVGGALYLDGSREFRTGKFAHRERPLERWTRLRGEHVSGKTSRSFVFAELQPTDDPNLLIDSFTGQDPGRIELRIQRVVKGEKILRPVEPAATTSTYVHEQTKKLGCHVTAAGLAYESTSGACKRGHKFSKADGKYWARFIFKYRSANMLQAMGIMPPVGGDATQTGNDSYVKQSPSDEDDDSELEREEAEVAALQVALKARKDAIAAKRKIKREAEEVSLRPKRRKVKHEADNTLDRSDMPAVSEIIDLTSD